jgi:AraC-like DNA-binding protein
MASSDWIRYGEHAAGVEVLEAWFQGPGYHPHRHDTYAIGVTERGVQVFDYRGATRISLPGQVAVLHPDERHDGRAGTEAGFGYRLLYIDPVLIFEAVNQVRGSGATLPFVRDPVVTNAKLATAIRSAFDDGDEPLAIDELVVQLAEGLLEHDPTAARVERPGQNQPDLVMIERARRFLDAEKTRVVRSWELEALTGLSRYDFARQFRTVMGTSPYRYLLMRRLDFARALIGADRPLVDVALESGFADQAHFTRVFTAAYGVTPARYGELVTVS